MILGAKGGGSAIVEALFVLAGLPYDVEYLEWETLTRPGGRLLSVNPLGQIPTVLLGEGGVLTETAAIALWVGDQCPASGLVPEAQSPLRRDFLRWLLWLASAVYPTFNYGDSPERYVPSGVAAKALRAATDRRREALWRQLERVIIPEPWLLGRQLTALDVYVAVMSEWRPGRAWFTAECRRLAAVARQVRGLEILRPVGRANDFDWPGGAA